MISVLQISDCHFTAGSTASHGGIGYDTEEVFERILEHTADIERDLTVVTGDITDAGTAADYEVARKHLSRLPGPIAVLPGNHDSADEFCKAELGDFAGARAWSTGAWRFLFVDSNGDGMEVDEQGRARDLPNRLHSNGGLTRAEEDFIRTAASAPEPENVFVWVHHPPSAFGMFESADYTDQWEALLSDLPNVRGIGAGHVHTDRVHRVAERPVFFCPALTISIDFDARTTIPPGYRTYTFSDAGEVTSECVLLEGDRWGRIHIPDGSWATLMGLGQ